LALQINQKGLHQTTIKRILYMIFAVASGLLLAPLNYLAHSVYYLALNAARMVQTVRFTNEDADRLRGSWMSKAVKHNKYSSGYFAPS